MNSQRRTRTDPSRTLRRHRLDICMSAGWSWESHEVQTTSDVCGAQAAASRGLGQTVVPTIERVAPVVTSAMSEQNLESPG